MKTFKFLMLIALAISITYCTNDGENGIEPENIIVDQEEVSSGTLEKLQHMGFDVNRIPPKIAEGGVIVDGDIFVTNESIETVDFQKQAFFSLVSCNRVRTIRIQNRLGNNAAGRGFQRGINLWNRVNGTTLRLINVSSNPDIVVRLARRNEIGGWGLGEFPTNGVEGGLIILNLNEPYQGRPVTSREWGNILAHEIGHNIGFLHSEQGFFGTQVPGTPNIDRRSIMTSGSNPSVVFNANSVSSNDARAVRRMYTNNSNRLCR